MTDKEPLSDLSPEEDILHEVSVKLLSSSEPRQVLELIAYHAAKLVGAGKTSINLNEDGRLRTWAKFVEPGGYFEFLASKRVGAHALPPETHLHMYETLRSGRPRIVQSHTIHDLKERVVGAPLTDRPEVFYIFEPLRTGDEVLGVAAINLTREQLEAITPRQRRTLEQLLSLAAVALSNARLFDQLRRAKADVERLIHSSLDGIVAFDLEGRCTIWNPGMERISGMRREEVLGKRTLDLFPFLKEIGEDRCLHEALEGKTCISEDRPYVIPQTGRQGFFEARYSPLVNETGEVTGGLAIVRDITERKRAEEEIRSLARFPAENPNPVLRVAQDCTILYANEASRPLLTAWRCRVGQPLPLEWREQVARVLSTGLHERIEVACGPQTLSLTFAPVVEGGYINLYGLDITERKGAEEALRASEERFRTLAAVAPAGIIFADQRGHLTYANEHYCQIAGRSEDELKGWGWAEAIHPEDRERISREWAQAAASGRRYTTHEYRFLHRDDGVVWAWANTAPLHGASGELLGHVAVVADITERKRAEEELRQSEERYTLAQRAAGIGSWDWDILTGGLSWSDTIEPIFGFAPGQFVRTYEAFLACVHDGDRQFVIDSVNACVEKGTDYDIEHRIVWPDGAVRWVSETGDVIRDEAGRAVRMLGVVQDITERVLSAQERKAHAALLGAVFEGSQNPLVYLDRDFNFVQVNEAYARACSRSKEEFIGRNHFDLYPHEENEAVFRRVRESGEPYVAVARPFTFPDHPEWGETYWDWTLTPLKDAAGQVEGFVFSLVDVTERIRRQQALEEANRRLEESLDYQRAVLDSLEEAVLSLDLAGRIVYANPAASRTFGYGDEELRRLRMCELRKGCVCGLQDSLVRQLENSAAPLHEQEVEYRAGGGRFIYGRQTLTPLRDHGGNLIGAVAVVEDISTVRRLEGQAAYLAEEVDELRGQSSLVFVSQGMRRVVKQVELVARTDSTVLITGETGTGKELVARLIHDKSPRKDKPLVKVHCAALSPGLIESEFFGHEKGAFTGAISRKTGRFELADGGTIFLDEMGDIPLETQIKLLRVIQEREFERVGGTRPIKVDVRIVAATNRDVEAAVEAGTFRRDLYYRINVFPIRVPPLRERAEAIPVLAAHFARGCAKILGRPIEGISPEGLRRLQDYAWPGNVRELRNVIERAVITSAGPIIQVDPLGRQAPPEEVAAEPLDLEEAERRHILSVLEMTSWRVEGGGGAAELLNMNPSTLRSRLKKLGIAKPSDHPRGMARPAVNTRD